MIFPEAIFTHPLLHALGWILLHFLWQGALVALLLAGVLTLLRERLSHARYAAACAALALMLLLLAVTFWRISGASHSAVVDEMTLRTASPLYVGSVAGQIDQSVEGPKDGSSKMVFPIQRLLLTERLDSLLP